MGVELRPSRKRKERSSRCICFCLSLPLQNDHKEYFEDCTKTSALIHLCTYRTAYLTLNVSNILSLSSAQSTVLFLSFCPRTLTSSLWSGWPYSPFKLSSINYPGNLSWVSVWVWFSYHLLLLPKYLTYCVLINCLLLFISLAPWALRGQDFCLSCSLLESQHLEQCLAQNKHLKIFVEWMD